MRPVDLLYHRLFFFFLSDSLSAAAANITAIIPTTDLQLWLFLMAAEHKNGSAAHCDACFIWAYGGDGNIMTEMPISVHRC